jgi:hypothetical protein
MPRQNFCERNLDPGRAAQRLEDAGSHFPGQFDPLRAGIEARRKFLSGIERFGKAEREYV